MVVALVASLAWTAFGGLAIAFFASRGTLEAVVADDADELADADEVVTLDASADTLDLYERKVSEQGDRFDSSNGILVGVLGAQVAVFVFYADVFARSFGGVPDYWFAVVLGIAMGGIVLSCTTLRASDYRLAPQPEIFAVIAAVQGLEEARAAAVADMSEAYAENTAALESRQRGLTWALIVTVVSVLAGLVIESSDEREHMSSPKPSTSSNDKKPLGKPNGVVSYKVGRSVVKIRLGPDGNAAPGAMIERVPGVLGFGKRPA